MFPIPFNFPFRKKDGSIVSIDDAISSGGGGEPYTLPTASASTKGGIKIGSRLTMTGEVLSANAQIPAYTSSDNGKVLTVNDSGELEWDTKGTGGGDSMITFDFTKYGSRTLHNVNFSSNGAYFNSSTAYIILLYNLDYSLKDVTIYVDVDILQLTQNSSHQRFLMTTSDSGLIYRSSGVWGFYSNNSWATDSNISDGGFFNNSKIKVYVDNDNKWHIYKNNTLVYEPNIAAPITELYIGSSSGSFRSASNFKSLRIYNGDYTET